MSLLMVPAYIFTGLLMLAGGLGLVHKIFKKNPMKLSKEELNEVIAQFPTDSNLQDSGSSAEDFLQGVVQFVGVCETAIRLLEEKYGGEEEGG